MPYEQPHATFKAEALYVERIGDLQVISDKFQKREMILTDRAEKYPLHLAVQFQRKEAGKCDLVRVGDLVDVHGELRGREWNGRYYVDVIAHEIHRIDGAGASAPAARPASPSAPSTPFAGARPTAPDHLAPSAAAADLAADLPF